jgi:hypothetical protein
MTRFSFYPVGGSYLWVVLAALVLLGLLAWGPGRDRISRSQWFVLLLLRVGVIALVVLAMLRPTVVYTEMKKESASVILLLDKTRSMSVGDAFGGKRTRWEALRQTVTDARTALRDLTEDFEIAAYTFDAEAHPVDVEKGAISLAEMPEGEQTAIGAVLARVLEEEAGRRLLAVVLLSDGAQRAVAPYDMLPQTAAGRLKRIGTPLYTLPIGQSLGRGQTKDVAIEDLRVNQSVYVKNRLAVAGEVRVSGYANREVPVELLFETPSGKMEVVERVSLRTALPGQSLPVRFDYAPQVAGEFRLTLRAVPASGEKVTSNNQWSTFVNVLKGGVNVLYLEGAPPRQEQTFIIRALRASPNINVDYPVPPLDPAHPESRPGDFADRFQPGKYEVYMLGDLDSSIFRGNELADLAQAVDGGAGLIMLGGFRSFGPGGYASTKLADVLPVRLNRFDRQPLDEPVRPDRHVLGKLKMRLTRLGETHFALMLADSRQANAAVWAKLPALDGANRFREIKPGGARVLAYTGANVPLLVDHTYGRGRVMAFAGDSTWHWWMQGHEAEFKRFWRQIILWLARKDQADDQNVWIRLPKRRFAPAELVEFTAGVETATGEPVPDAEFETEVIMPDGSRSPLRLVRQQGQMAGSLRDTSASGDYTIELKATRNGVPLGSTRARFLVFQQDLELDNPAADADLLDSLAKMTGGESLAPEQLPQLLEQLATRSEALEIQKEVKRTLWDRWTFFLLLVGLLTVEWYFRKRWRLV